MDTGYFAKTRSKPLHFIKPTVSSAPTALTAPKANQAHTTMDKRLLDILVCPLCKSTLQLDAEKKELICKADRLAYPIRNDIPVMLVDEARSLSEQEI